MGSAIHEHATCRMGDDPKRGPLNKFNQMHDVKNVFVVDGSSFTTASEKNPTLTILALSWRATDYLGRARSRRAICSGPDEEVARLKPGPTRPSPQPAARSQ